MRQFLPGFREIAGIFLEYNMTRHLDKLNRLLRKLSARYGDEDELVSQLRQEIAVIDSIEFKNAKSYFKTPLNLQNKGSLMTVTTASSGLPIQHESELRLLGLG